MRIRAWSLPLPLASSTSKNPRKPWKVELNPDRFPVAIEESHLALALCSDAVWENPADHRYHAAFSSFLISSL